MACRGRAPLVPFRMPDTTLADARCYFEESQAASSVIRQNASDDIEFARLAVQWPAEMQRQRQLEGRPCLTINGLPATIRQVPHSRQPA